MKGAVAAMACAFVAIRRAGVPLKRPVTLTAVASEEKGNRGTAALVRQGVRAACAVVGEPTGLDLVVAHKGVDRYQVIVEGRAAHESMPERGLNAIVQAAYIITALDASLLPKVKEHSHPVLGQATYNIGTIEGGISRNMVPDRCMFRIAKRWLPGDSPEAIRAELEAAIRAARPEAQVSLVREADMERVPHPPLELEPGHPLIHTLAEAISHVTGQSPALLGWAAFTDGALLQAAGIPTIVFGPGDLALAHGDEEHIVLSELVTAAEIYAAFAAMAGI
jgi:acetylornithine deacetylase/succinyl-diaminopimelate desuccinylase-like protein